MGTLSLCLHSNQHSALFFIQVILTSSAIKSQTVITNDNKWQQARRERKKEEVLNRRGCFLRPELFAWCRQTQLDMPSDGLATSTVPHAIRLGGMPYRVSWETNPHPYCHPLLCNGSLHHKISIMKIHVAETKPPEKNKVVPSSSSSLWACAVSTYICLCTWPQQWPAHMYPEPGVLPPPPYLLVPYLNIERSLLGGGFCGGGNGRGFISPKYVCVCTCVCVVACDKQRSPAVSQRVFSDTLLIRLRLE